MKSIYITLFSLLLSFSIFSQEYLIDSIYRTYSTSADGLLSENMTKFTYDEEERLIEERRESVITQYTYLENQTNITRFDSYGALLSEDRKYFDENGFEIFSESYGGALDDLVLYTIDSTYRNDKGMIISTVAYNIENGNLVLDRKLKREYFPNDDLKLSESTSYLFDEVGFITLQEWFQNDEEEIISYVYTFNNLYFGPSISTDTTFYDLFDGYRNATIKSYEDGIFDECTQLIWNEYTPEYRELLRSTSPNQDCTDNTPEQLRKFYLSNNKIFSQDSAKYYRFETPNQPSLLSFNRRFQDGDLGDDQIIVESYFTSYNFDESYDEYFYKEFYNKSQIVNTKDQELLDLKLNVYPNPITVGQTLTFDTEIKQYNSVKILDVAGRTVSHLPVSGTKNYIQAPNEKGIYYVRLYDKFTAVTKAVKLIVQ